RTKRNDDGQEETSGCHGQQCLDAHLSSPQTDGARARPFKRASNAVTVMPVRRQCTCPCRRAPTPIGPAAIRGTASARPGSSLDADRYLTVMQAEVENRLVVHGDVVVAWPRTLRLRARQRECEVADLLQS